MLRNYLLRRRLIQTKNRLLNPFIRLSDAPIIVLGNQKSGTSAIAHLLADYGSLSKTIDIPPLWPPVGVEIMQGKKGLDAIVRQYRVYFSADLIKEPMLTFFADQLLTEFPHARYVFVVRNPYDNIYSLLASRGIPGHLSELSGEYLPTKPQHKIIVDASVWGGEAENYVGVLAHRWNTAVNTYLNANNQMILARYEDFCQDKVGFISELGNQLNIRQKQDIADKVDIQYQPSEKRGKTREEFFGDNLSHIRRICRSHMIELCYEQDA